MESKELLNLFQNLSIDCGGLQCEQEKYQVHSLLPLSFISGFSQATRNIFHRATVLVAFGGSELFF